MTRLQYDTVVKDLLGVTTLASANNQPPSALLAEDSTGPLTDIAWNGYLGAAEKVAAEVMASATNKVDVHHVRSERDRNRRDDLSRRTPSRPSVARRSAGR